jgi:gluconolactonase
MRAVLDRFDELVGGLDHPEGVAWGHDGRVYAGGEAGQVYAVTLDGRVRQIGATGGFAYGVTLDGAGRVLMCDYGNACVSAVGPDGAVSLVTAGTDERPMQVPNFSAFDDAGNLYVTDSGTWGEDDGVIFRLAADGTASVWTHEVGRFPNGCAVTAEGDALLVVESRGRRVVRIAFGDDGSAAAAETVVELPGSQPDGISLDAEGGMFVSCYRPDRIYRIPPGGDPQVWAEDPDGVVLNQPANTAFVGERLDRLVVSSLGGWSLMIADVEVPGLPMRAPGG